MFCIVLYSRVQQQTRRRSFSAVQYAHCTLKYGVDQSTVKLQRLVIRELSKSSKALFHESRNQNHTYTVLYNTVGFQLVFLLDKSTVRANAYGTSEVHNGRLRQTTVVVKFIVNFGVNAQIPLLNALEQSLLYLLKATYRSWQQQQYHYHCLGTVLRRR